MHFTTNELTILYALYLSMQGNGFDFGFADDCRVEGKTARQCQGTLRQLHKKLSFYVDPEFNQVCIEFTRHVGYEASFYDWLAAIPRRERNVSRDYVRCAFQR